MIDSGFNGAAPEANKIEWDVVSDVYKENSFGIVDEAEKVELKFHVSVGAIKEDGSRRGSFEWYSPDLEWYAEGGLWFREDELVDYDGVYSLSDEIILKLHDMGFDVKDMAESCAPSLGLHK